MLAQHLTEYFEECVYCGKCGLKRSHASLYELNGVLHICKTLPLKHQQLTWNRNDNQTHQNDIVQDDWEYLGEQARGNDYGSWYQDTH